MQFFSASFQLMTISLAPEINNSEGRNTIIMKKIIALVLCMVMCLAVFTACNQTSASAETRETAESSVQESSAVQTDTAMENDNAKPAQAPAGQTVSDADMETIINAGLDAQSKIDAQSWNISTVSDETVLRQIMSNMGMGDAPNEGGTAPNGMQRPEMPEGFTPGEMPDDSTNQNRPEGFQTGEKPTDMPSGGPGGGKPSGGPEGNMPGGDRPSMPENGNAQTVEGSFPDAPIVIVVSNRDGAELDADLVAESMATQAQALGYTAEIIMAPDATIDTVNQNENKDLLDIPDDMSAVCLIVIGRANTTSVDMVAGATTKA